MKLRPRTILIIPALIAEVICLLVAAILIPLHRPTALRWTDFIIRTLPDPSWYGFDKKLDKRP